MTDDELLTAFESCVLPKKQWSHQAHVRVGFVYVSRLGLDGAMTRMRSSLLAYNALHGGDGPGYHETTTRAFLQLIHQAIQVRGPFADSDSFCHRSPELLDPRVLLCYYTWDRIMSRETKQGFVEPDIAPLSRIGLAYPEFGRRVEGVDYTLRPGSYGVIHNNAGQIAVVRTPTGLYLPGGGQKSGETAVNTLHREALEECGLTIQLGPPLGMADELVHAVDERRHVCKRCTFYAATCLGRGPSAEPDHELNWLPPQQAVEQLSHGSQRWAVGNGFAGHG